LITQIFDAPRELVFRAWTDAEWLPKWYAPDNCTIEYKHLDIREGGTFHSCINNPQYGDCWAIGEYKEIVSPERLVFTLSRADEEGNFVEPASVGMDPAWPAVTLVSVTFTEHEGKTKMTLSQTVSEALAIENGAHPSWLQQLNNLQAFIVNQ
jgi:uncharacterized protein YndB with AHSA1/START domain